jgi:hypothetical protein
VGAAATKSGIKTLLILAAVAVVAIVAVVGIFLMQGETQPGVGSPVSDQNQQGQSQQYTQPLASMEPISTCAELQGIDDGDYYLDADIDCAGKEFEVIRTFEGTLDGRGHSISNLVLNNEGAVGRDSGLIGTNAGYVKNLHLLYVDIIGASHHTAGLVGEN